MSDLPPFLPFHFKFPSEIWTVSRQYVGEMPKNNNLEKYKHLYCSFANLSIIITVEVGH